MTWVEKTNLGTIGVTEGRIAEDFIELLTHSFEAIGP